jgi:hypothetical protein
VSELKAGRELDRLIETKVFGTRIPKAEGLRLNPPPYSTDIAAAWTVAEKMRERGSLVTVKSIPKESAFILEGSRSEYDAPCPDRQVGKGKVCCQLHWMGEGFRHDELAMADTAPLAICLAALKAVGGAE